ncbi:hypothetical protein CYMTET_4574 [Cymbomonas tetramitiformis]|uniref:Uncharacterized protein n=1 Tax=Cymbomonas tetramitiformis TaxID=36881 RepID=A0AAE0H139_9CHLO|nr:hypothetical protein CYMTET_4574 [Cymbomonas tetramitiformis]
MHAATSRVPWWPKAGVMRHGGQLDALDAALRLRSWYPILGVPHRLPADADDAFKLGDPQRIESFGGVAAGVGGKSAETHTWTETTSFSSSIFRSLVDSVQSCTSSCHLVIGPHIHMHAREPVLARTTMPGACASVRWEPLARARTCGACKDTWRVQARWPLRARANQIRAPCRAGGQRREDQAGFLSPRGLSTDGCGQRTRRLPVRAVASGSRALT